MSEALDSTTQRTMFVPDVHAPFHDRQAVAVVLEFCRFWQPHYLIFLGDVFDAYQQSRFDKDVKRLAHAQADLDSGIAILKAFCDSAPDAEKHFVEGNHEARFHKFVSTTPQVAGLRGLDPRYLFGLDELGIQFHPESESWEHNGVVVTHGSKVAGHSGYTAKAELDKWGCSGVSGHTHRLATHYRSTYRGDLVWCEGGCLCNLNPEYVKGYPNWQHGFVLGEQRGSRFQLSTIYIDRDYEILWGGNRIKAPDYRFLPIPIAEAEIPETVGPVQQVAAWQTDPQVEPTNYGRCVQ